MEEQRPGSREKRGGRLKLLILLAVLLLGGGGLGVLLGGPADQPSGAGQQVPASPDAGTDLSALLGGLKAGSAGGWLEPANTGILDTSVAASAREKRTRLLGGNQDTATIMVYMCGADLESRSGMGTSDLQEMLAADLGQNVNLLVYTGGCAGWRNSQVSSGTNQIWQVKNGRLISLEENLGQVPMTDPGTLAGYVAYCAQRYPASRYGLILWDHGGGSISGYGYDEQFPDSGSMGLADIHTALERAGVDFDFVGFDACLMATAENALMLTRHADYLIASEEIEPGAGWYYTGWLTALGQAPSMPTIELGRIIADDFVDTCARQCPGQLTTLSVVDLAELEATLPASLAAFSQAASDLIAAQQYRLLADARSSSREFAQSSCIDHVDLVHLAKNLGGEAGSDLAGTLLSAVKYNRTSSNMTNAYGLSIYFPYQNAAAVDKAVESYRQIGLDASYVRCIQQFASLEVSGQAVSGGTASPLTALLGSLSGGSGGTDRISQLLGSFWGGGYDCISGLDGTNTGFLGSRALELEETAQYLAEHSFDASALAWDEGEDGTPVLRMRAEQWRLVQSLELNLFYDDGGGYIDLGLDSVFAFDQAGGLLGAYDGTWLAIEGQPVAYYHIAAVGDGENYAMIGRVPAIHNGRRAELLLVFDNETPDGYVAGVRTVYAGGETETAAKNGSGLQAGDTLAFLCGYYGRDGSCLDSFLLGEPLTVPDRPLEISRVPLEGRVLATYRFTDFFNQHYWTPAIPE